MSDSSIDRQASADHFSSIARLGGFLGRCTICDELVQEGNDAAEMHHPDNSEEMGGIVHATCGLVHGWKVS